MSEKETTQQDQFYSQLHPILQELELVRRDQLNRMAFILIALLVAVAVGMLLLIPTFIIVILFLSLPVYLLMFGSRRRRLDVRSEFRPRVMRAIAASLPGWEYDQHRFMPRADYEIAGFNLPEPDVYEGQDLFYGTQHGTAVRMSDLLTRQQERSPDGSIQYTTLFNGLMLSVRLPFSIQGRHYLPGSADHEELENFLDGLGDINTLRPEQMADPSGKIGTQWLYSTLDPEASGLFSGRTSEILNELSALASKPLLMTCQEDRFSLAVPMPEKTLEPSVFRSLLRTDEIDRYRSVLELLLALPQTLTERPTSS